MARGIFMYKDKQIDQAERYERKMQLVQAVRSENQANRQRIQHRNHIFYQGNGEVVPLEAYDMVLDTQPKNGMHIGRSFLGLRICVSVLCVFAFWGIKTEKIQGYAGVDAKEIKAYVAQDFSKVVVDYMKNFTYTLNYEKTSIK